IEAAAARHGLELVRTVVAIDVSGRHTADDPQFKQLFADLRNSDVAGVVVAEQSRIFRPENFGDYAILDNFSTNKKLVFLPDTVIDPNTSEGRMSLVLN